MTLPVSLSAAFHNPMLLQKPSAPTVEDVSKGQSGKNPRYKKNVSCGVLSCELFFSCPTLLRQYLSFDELAGETCSSRKIIHVKKKYRKATSLVD